MALALALLLSSQLPELSAQQGEVIQEVLLEGRVGVDHELIKANLRTRPGRPYDSRSRAAVRRSWAE